MTKLLGCLAILSAAVLYLTQEWRERTILLHTVRELQNAIENIATAIRCQQLPLPQAIRAQATGRYTGFSFREIVEKLQGEIPLQSLWQQVFTSYPPEIGNILCPMTLQGDREHLLAQFDRAAGELDRYYHTLQRELRDKNKLSSATALSGAAVLMILLL